MSYSQFAYIYDRLMEDMPYGEWLAFAKQAWKHYNFTPASVADLGCGTGSLSIPLAMEGLQVIGIDISEDMLSVAVQKAHNATVSLLGGSLQWIQQDMREWELPEPVDSVISFCDCMNYLLEEEDIVRSIRQTFAALKSGGLFVFDVHTPRQLEAYAESQPFFLNDDDVSYIWTSDYDKERMEIEHALTIYTQAEPNGSLFRRIDEFHRQRAYSLTWLEQQLKLAGFADITMSADFRWGYVPGDAAERAFFAARKP